MRDDFVEKTSVAADLYLTDGSYLTGQVYVEHGMSLLGSMKSLLVSDRRLVPFRGESGELIFVGRNAISTLRFEFDGTIPDGLEASILMRMTVAGGHQLEGVLHLPDSGRISDMLDAAGEWMLVVADNRAMWMASDMVIKWEAP